MCIYIFIGILHTRTSKNVVHEKDGSPSLTSTTILIAADGSAYEFQFNCKELKHKNGQNIYGWFL